MITVLESLNLALHELMKLDNRVVVLGEDILDPYGGAFKVTRGLSEEYPQRVITTPISEAGMLGIASGLALRGLLPIVEIMFGDFLTLASDQIINHAAKFRWMYNDQVQVPIVIRTPMGGRRGYGPTHSQTMEKFFLGVPGLCVLAPCHIGNPGNLLKYAVLKCEDPVLFIENKLLYTIPLENGSQSREFHIHNITTTTQGELSDTEQNKALEFPPTYSLTVRDAPPATITIAAYGHMVEYARQALLDLAYEDEIFCELIIPTQLTPWEMGTIFNSVRKSGRLIVVEEGTKSLGWGAEIAARVSEWYDFKLDSFSRVAAREFPIPASEPLETSVLPGKEQIKQAAKLMM